MRFKSGRYTGVNRYLLNENGRTMTSSELLDQLNRRGWTQVKGGNPIHPDIDFVANVDGINIHVRAKTKRGMEKRVYAECPKCRGWFEAGHLHQHVEAKHL